ncbi:unnamed protein product [Effrenium voratum]|uniref:Cupin-like domain-containing protein n=1 Tax=Effrenium voratum TaxID=2562239 RepID=A0AA36MQ58_9DINO|nr:unnamed protein product [Effrenium voratum]
MASRVRHGLCLALLLGLGRILDGSFGQCFTGVTQWLHRSRRMGHSPDARAVRRATADPFAMSRAELKSALFSALDQDGDRRLLSPELRQFAELTGFEGDPEEWEEEYRVLCEAQGCDLAAFGQLLDDDEDGLYCADAELAEMLQVLIQQGARTITAAPRDAGRKLGAAIPAGPELFQREREAGLYDGEWKPWDPQEGVRARTPRLGEIGSLEGCPSSTTVQEALMFVNEQVQSGIFGDQSGQAGERLSELLALQGRSPKAGAGWFEFRLDEKVLDEEQLADLVLAPAGWRVDHSLIPTGYMMHIMSVGSGVKATLCGREGLPIVNSLHRDVSKCKRLCDTGLCGVVGRKRVLLFAPDAFPASSKVLRSPDMDCEELRALSGLAEEEAWQRMEQLARAKGGVLDLMPGQFVFVPHGWWHAVRPIDDFTFITGPSQLSNLGVGTT